MASVASRAIGQGVVEVVGHTPTSPSHEQQMVRRARLDQSRKVVFVFMRKKMLKETAVYDEYVRWCGRSGASNCSLLPDYKILFCFLRHNIKASCAFSRIS